MILRKIVNENGEEIYTQISMDDALKLNKKDLVFTSEDEEDDYDDKLEELEDSYAEKEDSNGIHIEIDDDNLSEGININLGDLKRLGAKLNKFGAKMSRKFASGSNFNTKECNSKAERLIKALPFLDEDDLHEIIDDVINNSEEYGGLPLAAIMPFLSEKDCDNLFLRAMDTNDFVVQIEAIAPFVSEKCLDRFVDEYISGKYQDVDVDSLYPFMSSKSVKKLFKYVLLNK